MESRGGSVGVRLIDDVCGILGLLLEGRHQGGVIVEKVLLLLLLLLLCSGNDMSCCCCCGGGGGGGGNGVEACSLSLGGDGRNGGGGGWCSLVLVVVVVVVVVNNTRVFVLPKVALAVHHASVNDVIGCRASTPQCKDNSKQKQTKANEVLFLMN